MSLMKNQQHGTDSARILAGLVDSGDDDDHGNNTSPALTENTLVGLQTDTYVDEPSVEEAEICLQRFREEMMVSTTVPTPM